MIQLAVHVHQKAQKYVEDNIGAHYTSRIPFQTPKN